MIKRRILVEGRVEVRFSFEIDAWGDDLEEVKDKLFERLEDGDLDDEVFGTGVDRTDFDRVDFKVLSEAETDEPDPRQVLLDRLKAAQAKVAQ